MSPLYQFLPRILRILVLTFYAILLSISLVWVQNIHAGQVTLAWDPNTEPDLAGYKLYYGNASGNYRFSINVGNKTTCTVSNLEDGRAYYFTATAYDTSGYESGYSDEVVYNVLSECTYSISPTSQAFSSSGGAGTVSVTTLTGCTWTATSNASWLIITSNSSGGGNGTVNYSVLTNTDSSLRTGILTIAGKIFTVTQSEVSQYTLTITKAGTGNGTVTTNPSGTNFNVGTVVTLTATPDTNSVFAGWSGGCTGTSPNCKIIMNANSSVTATFAIKTYTITATPGTNGSIFPQGAVAVNYGASKAFTITPNTGYGIADVKMDAVSQGPIASYTFTNVTANHTIEASFTVNSSIINLLSNGDFEMGNLSKWENGGGITINDQSRYSGNYGAKMATNGRIDQRFRTTIGKTYYVSARIRIDKQIVAPEWGGLVVEIWNRSWKKIASSPNLTETNSPIGSWTRVNFSFVATTRKSRLIYQNFSKGQFEASADNFIVSPNPIPDGF